MYATVICGKVQYFGSDFQEATKVFANRISTDRAAVLTVNSITEADELATLFSDLVVQDEQEVEAVADEFSNAVVDACEELLNGLESIKVEDFTAKVQQNAKDITKKIGRFGSEMTTVIGEGLEKLGKGIRDSVANSK